MVKTMNQFIDWFVGRLTGEELKQAAEEAGLNDCKGLSAAEARKRLRQQWKNKRNKKIAQYIESWHQQAREELNRLDLVERRGSLERWVAGYGLRTAAYLFVVSPDELMQEKGFELINRRGDEVPPVTDDGPLYPRQDHQETSAVEAAAGAETAAVPGTQTDPVSLLEQAARGIKIAAETGQITIDRRRLSGALKDVNELWEQVQADWQRHDLAQIKEGLSALSTTYAPVLHYYKLDELPSPPDERTIPPDPGGRLLPLLGELCRLCGETLPWLQLKVADLDEDRKRMEEISRLQGEVTARYREIVSLLKPSGGGPDRGHGRGQAPEPEPVGEGSISGAVSTEAVAPESEEGPALSEAEDQRCPDPVLSEAAPGPTAEEPGLSPKPALDGEYSHRGSAVMETADPGAERSGVKATPDGTIPTPPAASAEAITEDLVPAPRTALAVCSGEPLTVSRAEGPADKGAETPENANAGEIWRAVAAQDPATAYWLAREAEHKEIGGFPPSWLFLAAHLGKEADWDGEREKELFRELIVKHEKELLSWVTDRWAEGDLDLFLFSIALRPTLLAPETMARAWLQQASCLVKNQESELARLIKLVIDFSSNGKINSGMLEETLNEEVWKRRIESVTSRVEQWCREAKTRHLNFAPATEVLGYLTSSESCLREALDLVANHSYDRVHRVEMVVHDRLAGPKEMNELLRQTTKACFTSSARAPIVGVALRQLFKNLQELKKDLQLWIETVKEKNDRNRSNNWLYQQTQSFRDDFIEYSRRLRESRLDSAVASETGGAIRRFAKTILDRVIAETLRSKEGVEAAPAGDWRKGLIRPLLLVKEAPIDEESLQADLTAPFNCSLMEAISQRRTLEEAFQLHLANYDFLPAGLIVQELRNEGSPLADKLAGDLAGGESEVKILLAEQVDYVRDQIVQATLDHVLSEERRSAEEGRLLSIEGEVTRRRCRQFRELEQIQSELNSLRQERQDSLQQHIEVLTKECQQNAATPLQKQGIVQYLERAEEALQRRDLPIADEYLLYAEEALDTGQMENIAEQDQEIDYVGEFVAVCDDFFRYLESCESRNLKDPIELLTRGKSIAGLEMKRVPGARRREIKMGLEAWLALKRYNHSAQQQPQLIESLTQLMEYVGFRQPEVKYIKGDNQSAYLSARMSAGALSPLADFGSLRQNQYELVLVYSRPSDTVIGQILRNYGVIGKSPLVIFLGRLTGQQRREWSNYCRENGLTALMIDEILVYYLASQRESRLQALISCGVAWGYEVPYLSFGVIPPEIFKGRAAMVRELADGHGSCIVYGGRQFGKSVLLHMVQLQYDDPGQGVHVIYDDIKPYGDPQGHLQPADLWIRLRDLLVDRKLLHTAVGEQKENISRKLIEKLKRELSLRVVLLLDEADNFLAADARQNFEELLELRRMMDQTERRFKVVFCGLHSVQRYCSGENHPFAQMMSRPLVVGPLEPRAARTLIVEPMAAVGFTFNGREAFNAVLRILCYTNYHPALIQYFCGELVKLVRRRLTEPPYRITVEDVEGVYRREDVRSFMRERFNWTLELDARYKMIVYTMIFEQLQERDGYRKEFTASGILDLLQQFWPEGFARLRLDEVKSLLEELIGLGVLVKRISGKYRLRNGNIVRALGSEQEIWDRMNDMMSQPPADTHDDAAHFRLRLSRRQRSPLTCRQVAELTHMRSGIGFVFGNQALGLKQVAGTLSYVVDKGNNHACSTLPPELVTAEQFVQYFENKKLKKGHHYYYSEAGSLMATGISLGEVIAAVSSSLKNRRQRNSTVRWLLLFDAKATAEWLGTDDWTEAESLVSSISYLQRWDRRMIRQYLDDLDLLSTQVVIDKIVSVTGGWPYLLTILWKMIRENSRGGDPQVQIEQLAGQLSEDDFREKFLKALEIDLIPGNGREMLRLFRELGPFGWESLAEGVAAYGCPHLVQLSPEQQRSLVQVLLRGGLLVEADDGLRAEPVAAGVIG